MSVTTVRLPAETEQNLENTASRLRRTKSWVINEALREYFDRHREDQERWEQTLEALADVAQGRVIDGEVVHEWLRSWGTDQELPEPKIPS
jgi:predicted transcriptional regulator